MRTCCYGLLLTSDRRSCKKISLAANCGKHTKKKLAFLCAVGHPVEKILKMAAKEKSQLVVMGKCKHGIVGAALIGSIARKIASDCDMPVLMMRQLLRAMPTR